MYGGELNLMDTNLNNGFSDDTFSFYVLNLWRR